MESKTPETIGHKPIIVPQEASQLFGAYLRQEFKKPLEAIGTPQDQRLVNFINDLERSQEVKLVEQDGFWDFEFSEEKVETVTTPSSFTLDKRLTPAFLDTIDHNVRNMLAALVRLDEKMPLKMGDTLTVLSDARELEMSRDENGKVKVIPLSHPTA